MPSEARAVGAASRGRATHRQIIHLVSLSFAILLLAANLAAGEKYRPLQSDDAPFGRYLVTLADNVSNESVERVAAELARAFGGRQEIYAADGFHGFAVVLAPARARQLSEDPRVVLVEEIAPETIAAVAPKRTPPDGTRGGAQANPGGVAPTQLAAPAITSARLRPAPSLKIKATSSTSEPWSGTYLYDAAGNIKAIGENRYVYDGVSRIRQATAITSSQSNAQHYNYDAFGNLLSVSTDNNPITLSVTVNSATNRIDAPCPQNANCLRGTFDEAGNQVAHNDTTTYVYDTANMMSESLSAAHEIFIYDADDQRIATIDFAGSAAQTWHYTLRDLGENVVRDLDDTLLNGAHSFLWRKDYVHRGSALMASVAAGAPAPVDRATHFHLDHLGTPRLTTDQLGRKLALHTYWAFGGEAPGSDSDSESRKFTGHERDHSTDGNDLDYMHARYYSSSAARFLSLDPVSGRSESPQTWNRYAYVASNPIRFVDPDGRVVELSSSGNYQALEDYVVATLQKPDGRVAFENLANDKNFTSTWRDEKITSEAQIKFSLKTSGDKVTYDAGETTATASTVNGKREVIGSTVKIDTARIQKYGPDRSGVTTVVHELVHNKTMRQGGELNADHYPTNATGPAEKEGQRVSAQQDAMSKQAAKLVLQQLIATGVVKIVK